MMRKIDRDSAGTMTVGQDMILVGYVGLAGTDIMARMKREELQSRYSLEWLEDISAFTKKLPDLLDKNLSFWRPYGATECEPVREGGVLAALWNLFGAYQLGFEMTLRQIPLRQETVEICEFFELNPYRLYSEGCYILTTDHGYSMQETLRRKGVPATVVGHITKGVQKILYQGEGQAYLDRPTQDELSKVVSL